MTRDRLQVVGETLETFIVKKNVLLCFVLISLDTLHC
jgi:hypothetical protein